MYNPSLSNIRTRLIDHADHKPTENQIIHFGEAVVIY